MPDPVSDIGEPCPTEYSSLVHPDKTVGHNAVGDCDVDGGGGCHTARRSGHAHHYGEPCDGRSSDYHSLQCQHASRPDQVLMRVQGPELRASLACECTIDSLNTGTVSEV